MADIASNTVKGAGLGFELGTIFPVIGNVVGAGAGAAIGALTSLVQGAGANKAKKDANNLMPSLYSPEQLAMLAEVDQTRKAYNAGSMFGADMDAVNASTAATQQHIARVTGGDIGGTIAGLLAAQGQGNAARNQILARSDQQRNFYNTFSSDLRQKIDQRALELQLAMASQKRAEWAQGSQDAFSNATNAAARTNPQDINWADLLSRHSSGSPVGGITPQTDVMLDAGPAASSAIPKVGGDLASALMVA